MRTKASLAFMSPVLAEAAFADRAGPRYPTGIAIKKGPKRWRYYVSQATLQGQRSNAGSIVRVPAAHVEALVTAAVGKLSSQRAASQTDIRNMIDRVEIGRASIQVQLSEVAEAEAGGRTLTLPWAPPSPYRKREIIQGVSDAKTSARPMRANARTILIEAVGDTPIRMSASIAALAGRAPRTARSALTGDWH